MFEKCGEMKEGIEYSPKKRYPHAQHAKKRHHHHKNLGTESQECARKRGGEGGGGGGYLAKVVFTSRISGIDTMGFLGNYMAVNIYVYIYICIYIYTYIQGR
jgi:hypothetical protein